MHWVYIIYSPLKDRFYVGETINVEERLLQHYEGYYLHASTSFTRDWKLKKVFSVDNRPAALKVE